MADVMPFLDHVCEWAKATYGTALQSHIDFLSIRPGWSELQGCPETLPEQIKARIQGIYVPEKYPEKKVCHISEYVKDNIGRQITWVQVLPY
jgi:hypothetical protein